MSLIELEGVTKRFGGVTALDGVSFSVAAGEVHAVMGENGAGKSSLMKVLAGVHAPDAGRVLLDGEPVRFRNPLDARRRGISVVFQELSLFPHRTVTANVFANRELRNAAGLLDHSAMRAQTRRALDALGATSVAPDARVGDLSVGERQLVELARALAGKSRVVILDEPNSALSGPESERLFQIVRGLRAEGVTVLYVSHRLEDVFALADRITVLRDGKWQSTTSRAETTVARVVAGMIGRDDPTGLFPERRPLPADAPVRVCVKGLRGPGGLGPVDFDARAGEVLGFAGLEGSGVDELFHVLFGIEPAIDGSVTCDGRPHRAATPRDAMRGGWGLVPASRREQGLMMEWDVRRNATLLVLDRLLTRLGLIDRAATNHETREAVRRLRIATDRIDRSVVTLSGGNQQKVLLAKWLATDPTVLILNDPTRGVDVGVKRDVYALCDELARRGMTILFASSEIEETLGLCDRILAMRAGRVVRSFTRGEADKAEVMSCIAGARAL